MPYIDQFLSVIVSQGGSDLHIGEGPAEDNQPAVHHEIMK